MHLIEGKINTCCYLIPLSRNSYLHYCSSPVFPLIVGNMSPCPLVWPPENIYKFPLLMIYFSCEKKMKRRHVGISKHKINFDFWCILKYSDNAFLEWELLMWNFIFDTPTFIIHFKFVCLSEITLSLDKRMICQNFENKVSWREIIRISVVRCSSRRQALHSGTSTAAVMLSPASQE